MSIINDDTKICKEREVCQPGHIYGKGNLVNISSEPSKTLTYHHLVKITNEIIVKGNTNFHDNFFISLFLNQTNVNFLYDYDAQRWAKKRLAINPTNFYSLQDSKLFCVFGNYYIKDKISKNLRCLLLAQTLSEADQMLF